MDRLDAKRVLIYWEKTYDKAREAMPLREEIFNQEDLNIDLFQSIDFLIWEYEISSKQIWES